MTRMSTETRAHVAMDCPGGDGILHATTCHLHQSAVALPALAASAPTAALFRAMHAAGRRWGPTPTYDALVAACGFDPRDGHRLP